MTTPVSWSVYSGGRYVGEIDAINEREAIQRARAVFDLDDDEEVSVSGGV